MDEDEHEVDKGRSAAGDGRQPDADQPDADQPDGRRPDEQPSAERSSGAQPRTEQPRAERLRAELHRAAASHRPDRARILARVERGMAEDARTDGRTRGARKPSVRSAGARGPGRAASWPRVAGATVAVAAVLAAGGYGVAGVLHEDVRVHTATTPDPTPTPTRTAPTGPPPVPDPAHTSPPKPPRQPERSSGGSSATSKARPPAGTRPPTAPASPPTPASNRVQDGRLWGEGAVDPHSHEFWAQSNITFENGEILTALAVELRIAKTEGVTNTGAWISLPLDDFTVEVREEQSGPAQPVYLLYRWTLKPGRTVGPGVHMAAGQYQHVKGDRDAGGDRYSVTTTAQGGQRATVRGGFRPPR
ncbi:hypothetical protein OG897_33295 [Streptomyces sp. NBC_00237]|uniref:hypothetical protein n=1 Tax=Streptomyces sp. NBC_00237 TaxID=2975687 RepID=UPI00225A35D4|nr:hypothetical protein [Streptomyces sp. NBC_00237]MCX5206268.1 hypothetical protein [Streptomyces sp. NBC_00237]